MRPFEIGYALAKHMLENNPPRTVGSQGNLAVYGELAEMVAMAGGGDYLEIGVFNGTSAIVAAKVKQTLGLGGMVVGLDDFAWYDSPRETNQEQLKRTRGFFEEYGVADGIELVLGTTFNFPEALRARRFCSAFIDGNHWYGHPYRDFLLIEPLVSGWVLFDDADQPSVMAAVKQVKAGSEWQVVKHENNCVLIRKAEHEQG